MKKFVKSIESKAENAPIRSSVVSPTEEIGVVSITHSQNIKQSIDYQSADAAYTIRVNCKDSPSVIRKTIRRAERIVEAFMVDKIKQQTELLRALGKQNR